MAGTGLGTYLSTDKIADQVWPVMKVNHINSSGNALLKRVRSLHERKFREKQKQFIIEGVRVLDEAVEKGLALHEVIVSESFLKDHVSFLSRAAVESVSAVDDRLFKEISATTTPSGVLAVLDIPHYNLDHLLRGDTTLIAIADAIQDPGNLGTMIRTSLAASASGMVLTAGTVDPFNPKVVRAAMGALFALPIMWDQSFAQIIAELRQRGVRILACDASARQDIFDEDLTGPLALCFGNEANGFTAEQLKTVDAVVSIPMNPASESLNVAVSSAVALFNAVQQRIKSGKKELP